MQQTLYDIKIQLHKCIIANACIKRETSYPAYLCVVRNCIERLTENMKTSKTFTKQLQSLIVTFTQLVTDNVNSETEAVALLSEIKQLQITQDIIDIDTAKQYMYTIHTHVHTQNICEANDFLSKFICVTQPHNDIITYKFIIKAHMHLRNLLQTHSTTHITNLHEFTNIKFYHNISAHFASVVLYHKYNMCMLLGSNKKMYIILNNKLVQAIKNNKLICWV